MFSPLAPISYRRIISPATREILRANRTVYVRTDGRDTNSGLINSASGAFLTIQKAIAYAGGLDLSIYNLTIQVGAGTYTAGAAVNANWVGLGDVILRGDTVTPSNVLISVTGGDCISVINGGRLRLGGFKLSTTTTGFCLYARKMGIITVDATMDFGACASNYAHISAGFGGFIQIGNASEPPSGAGIAYTISGGAGFHFLVQDGGMIMADGDTWTLTGTPAFVWGFAYATSESNIRCQASSVAAGTATGQRYTINSNAVIDGMGGNVNYFPGDSAGSVATGGVAV